MSPIARRRFLAGATSGGLLAGWFPSLADGGRATGAIPTWRPEDVRFSSETEPWVRLIEETPRDQVVQVMAKRVQEGQIGYRQFLAALFLAGIRNIQPRPSVGFKFHAVLVVNSAHLASLDAPESQKWLPIFWALDSFKSSQARDVQEGNWTMAAVDESRLPPLAQAVPDFRQAMHDWNEESVDVATAALARSQTSGEIFDLYAEYAARDFRSIGHKVIYLANCYRTLETIGWQHAEPVLRSLSYAILNHVGEPNPATSDLPADRDGRLNRQLASQLRDDWVAGQADTGATRELLQALQTVSAADASRLVFEQIQRGVAVQSVYDALFCFSAELTMRQPAIVPLHAVTTTNAMNFVFRKVRNPATRGFILLQNAAFLPHFRDEAKRRGSLADRSLESLDVPGATNDGATNDGATNDGATNDGATNDGATNDQDPQAVPQIFELLGQNPLEAARQTFGFLQRGNSVYSLIHPARELIFLKGNDSHDYKYSSAVLEDYFQVGPEWRDRYLAAALFKMRHAGEPTTDLVKRIQSALG